MDNVIEFPFYSSVKCSKYNQRFAYVSSCTNTGGGIGTDYSYVSDLCFRLVKILVLRLVGMNLGLDFMRRIVAN